MKLETKGQKSCETADIRQRLSDARRKVKKKKSVMAEGRCVEERKETREPERRKR